MKSFRVKKKLGQHFLKNKSIIEKITSFKNIKNKNIIEVGPGFGSLTVSILNKKPNSLVCIEKDINLKKHLDNLNRQFDKNLKIIYGDALKINLTKIIKKNIYLIANLPYNIASTLIINWLQYINNFKFIIVMVQKEVADRLTAKTSSKSYGRLSVLVQQYCYVEKKFDIKPENFSPRPKVNSSIVVITPKKKKKIDYYKMDDLLRLSFIHRRKQIKNNLINKYPGIEKILTKNKLKKTVRPQEISPNLYEKIYNSLYS